MGGILSEMAEIMMFYSNGKRIEPIERHKEIPEQLAKAIIKRNNLK